MSQEILIAALKKDQTVERDNIYIASTIAEKTVWDRLAVENPTHAVVSAADEATAAKKSEEQIADIKSHLKPGDIVLDCGTGYGRVAKYLLPYMPLKGYIGLDSSYQMLKLFKTRYDASTAEQHTPLLLLNADIHTVPLQSESVDSVIVSAVFLHNHKSITQKAMAEIRRVTKPGGTVLIYSSFPRAATLMGLQGLAYQALLNLLGKPFKNGPVRYFRRYEIMHLFDGFTEVELRPAGFALLPKTIIIFPKPLEILWRKGIANPVNYILEKITPARLKPYFAVHYDVIATR